MLGFSIIVHVVNSKESTLRGARFSIPRTFLPPHFYFFLLQQTDHTKILTALNQFQILSKNMARRVYLNDVYAYLTRVYPQPVTEQELNANVVREQYQSPVRFNNTSRFNSRLVINSIRPSSLYLNLTLTPTDFKS